MIRVIDVHQSFGSQQVLRGINLRVPKGEILAIIGRLGVKGGIGYAYEYAGTAIDRSSPTRCGPDLPR